MTKIISTASAASSFASSLAANITSKVQASIASFLYQSDAHVVGPSERLRYDTGHDDINPDRMRGRKQHDRTSLDREIMRRGF